MNTTSAVRRSAAVLGTLASLAAGILAAPADGAAPSTGHRTTLTFQVADCEGCTFQLQQGKETSDPQKPKFWWSKTKKVSDGEVSFSPLSKHTQGMSIIVRAPWEGHTGYLTTVAMRYGHEQVGDHVSFREARSKKRASACWEGTRSDAVTIPVVVREVRVMGVQERVKGSIAYLPETTSWLPPMRATVRGVLGSQEINICG